MKRSSGSLNHHSQWGRQSEAEQTSFCGPLAGLFAIEVWRGRRNVCRNGMLRIMSMKKGCAKRGNLVITWNLDDYQQWVCRYGTRKRTTLRNSAPKEPVGQPRGGVTCKGHHHIRRHQQEDEKTCEHMLTYQPSHLTHPCARGSIRAVLGCLRVARSLRRLECLLIPQRYTQSAQASTCKVSTLSRP